MNHTSKQPTLPALTIDLLHDSGILIDKGLPSFGNK